MEAERGWTGPSYGDQARESSRRHGTDNVVDMGLKVEEIIICATEDSDGTD